MLAEAGVARRAAAMSVRTEVWFLAIALVWGVVQVFIVPPFQVPDEGDHFFRAWALSTGQLTADGDASITIPARLGPLANVYLDMVGGGGGLKPLPLTMDGVPGFTSWGYLFDGSAAEGTLRIPSRVANYGPVGYLPQASAISLGQTLDASPLACFYLARLANLVAAIVMIALAIRLAPYGRDVYLFVALMPMTMFELASASCDAGAIAGALLFVSLALRSAHKASLSHLDALALVGGAAILLNIKPAYWALILLTVLIPGAAAGGRWRKWGLVGGCFIASALVAVAGFESSAAANTIPDPRVAPQITAVLANPPWALGVVLENLRDQALGLWLESIGVLGWFSVALPVSAYVAVLLCAPVVLIRGPEDKVPRIVERTVLAIVGVAVLLTLATVLFAFLTRPGESEIALQGRYLGPVWLTVVLSVFGVRLQRSSNLRRLTLGGVAVGLTVVNLATLVVAYH